jgi:peptidoglycan/xylan/chitin deacetylase (PgdA/CDA1 family)
MIWRSGVRALRRAGGAIVRQAVSTITHVSTNEPLAALTFDDGPDPLYTPRVLEILQKHRAQATFFMVGQTALRHPDLVQLVARGGHAIGNHSWDHPS